MITRPYHGNKQKSITDAQSVPTGVMTRKPRAGGSGAAASVLASVPWVAQWKFNGDGQDAIGTNHLTNNNSATFTTGLLGGASGATQLVRASNQYHSVANNAQLVTGNVDILIAVAVYLDSKPGSANMYIAGKASDGSNDEWGLLYRNFSGENRFAFVIRPQNGSAKFAVANTFGSPPLSTWCRIVAWFDSVGQTVNIKVNNGATDTVATAGVVPLSSSTATLYLGNLTGAASFAWDGRLDNFCYAVGAGAVPSAAVLTALDNGGAGTETLS